MSEGCGPVTTNLYEPGRWKLGTIGFEINGVEVKLDEKNENGEGEVGYIIIHDSFIVILVLLYDIICLTNLQNKVLLSFLLLCQ